MIRIVGRKEIGQRRLLLGIAFGLVLLLSATMPFLYAYSLRHASLAGANETAQLVLQNFRSYAVFVESNWLSRSLARVLMLLALLAGAGAIAGEREARTFPLLVASSVPVRVIVLLKYLVVVSWLLLIVLASTAVLAAHSLVEAQPLPIGGAVVASLVSFANAAAFLAVVFAASSVTTRTIYAGALALVVGFSTAFLLRAAGLDGTALGTNLFGSDGGILWNRAVADVAVSAGLVVAGLAVAFAGVAYPADAPFAQARRAIAAAPWPWTVLSTRR